MKNYVYIFLLFISCQGTRLNKELPLNNVIPVAKGVSTVVDKILLSKAIDDVELIPLETNASSLFNYSRIKNIVLTSNCIFVNTMDRVLCFDRAGKYKYDIGHLGQGSSDYNYCGGIGVNSVKRIVYIASGLGSNNELKSYSFTGKFIGSMHIAKYGAQMASSSYHREERGYCYINNEHLFRRLLPVYDGSKDIWQIERRDTLGNVIDKIYDPACLAYEKEMVRTKGISMKQLPYTWGTFSPMIDFFHDKTNILFEANDTIYSYCWSKKKMASRYIMNMDRNPKLDFKTLRVLGKSELYFKEIVAREIYESKDYLYISVEKDDNAYLVEWDKNSGNVCSIRNKGEIKDAILGGKIRKTLESGWTNDICGGPLFYPDHHDCDHWIGIYKAEDLLDLDLKMLKEESVKSPAQRDKLVNIIENITEDSNPVIIVATLKK